MSKGIIKIAVALYNYALLCITHLWSLDHRAVEHAYERAIVQRQLAEQALVLIWQSEYERAC